MTSEKSNSVLYNLYIENHEESGTRNKSSNSSKSHSGGTSYKRVNQITAQNIITNNNDWSNNAKLGLCSAHLLDCELLHQL